MGGGTGKVQIAEIVEHKIYAYKGEIVTIMSDKEPTEPITKESIPEEPEVTMAYSGRSEFYREIMPSYFWGAVRPGYIEAIAITTRTNALETIKSGGKNIVLENEEEICIKFTPQQAKLLTGWLLDKLNQYEDRYGKIKTDEDTRWIDDILRNIQITPREE
ncbi:MAG TPA: hypothetical protein HA349_03230 [Methanotrichaceae archaeon]|nr:hypothetical protein [Methanotrichaceae archaeon]